MTANGSDLRSGVSRETLDRLSCYVDLLKRWNPKINLVSKSTMEQVWTRHIEDSAQVFSLLPEDAKSWVDLGAGGGLPGVIVAILAAEKAKDLHVSLIEADQRKCAFLRTALRETGVAATVIPKRIEGVEPLCADVVSARALARLSVLLSHVNRHLRRGGTALLQKGESWRTEIEEAEETWRFTCLPHRSKTDPDAVILQIGEIVHA